MLFRSKKASDKVDDSRRHFVWQAVLLPPLLLSCDRWGQPQPLRPGMSLPSLELPLLDGKGYRLGESLAPALINFWATWCPPCRAEMASLDRLYNAYATRGLRVIAVSVDDDAHLVREFLRQTPLEFPILLDQGGTVTARRFGVSMFPTTFLINRQGQVSDIWIGERNWDETAIRTSIAQLIGR